MKEKRQSKSYDELEFYDDFMFKRVMEDPVISKMVLERILGVQIAKIEYRNTEESFKEAPDAKGIRLDVYLANEDTRFDIEMQTRPQDCIGKRAEFYQSNMVIDSLDSGAIYSDMKNCIVIFICLSDPFTDGLCRYTFTKMCHEKQSVNLDDGMTTIILNAAGRKDYNMQSLALSDAKREGLKQGVEQGKAYTLISMVYKKKKKGLSAADVAEFMEVDSKTINIIYDLIDECGIKDDSDESINKILEKMESTASIS